MDLHLKGNKVLITASSSGIGLAIGRVFLEEGAQVILNGRDREKLEKIVSQLRSEYTGAIISSFPADMTASENARKLKKYVMTSHIEKIDHLVLNLGTGKKEGDDLSVLEWQRFFQINLFSAVELLNSIIDVVTSSIVFISSIAGTQAISAPYAYSASKLAVLSLAKKLSVDYASKGIRVNTVIPGNIYFEGGRWSEIIKDNPSIVESYIKRETPLSRFGRPEEIANTVAFLCSNKSSYTTGSVVVIDGGQSKSMY